MLNVRINKLKQFLKIKGKNLNSDEIPIKLYSRFKSKSISKQNGDETESEIKNIEGDDIKNKEDNEIKNKEDNELNSKQKSLKSSPISKFKTSEIDPKILHKSVYKNLNPLHKELVKSK